MSYYSGRPQKYSRANFVNDMRRLMNENGECTFQFINHVIGESEEISKMGSALANNQQKISNTIVKFYGEKEKISSLFNELLQFIPQAIDFLKWRKEMEKLRVIWYNKSDEISTIINSLSDWNVRSYFYKQISLVESLIKGFLKRDAEAVKYFRQELINNNGLFSVILTSGIIKDKHQQFN